MGRLYMRPDSVRKYCAQEIEIWKNPKCIDLFPFCVATDCRCKLCPIYQYETQKNGTPTRCVDIVLLKKGKKGKRLRDYQQPRKQASKAMRKAMIKYLGEFPAKWEEFLRKKRLI